MKDFSIHTREKNIQSLEQDHFDIVIVGGGINGAGVARDAALRGLKVALVEAHDFAVGTSSRSSKLVHGGIRYLENMEFHLVFEALNERTRLFEIAPHLAHPLRFLIPLYKSSRVGMFKMGLGMWLYDALALFQAPEMHERLNANESMERMPILEKNELIGSYVYSDAYMDDDRLVHETLRAANEAGAVCANYVLAQSSVITDGKFTGLRVRDQRTQKEFVIHADHCLSTVGPWTDLVGEKLLSDWKKILRPTKGIHLTFQKDRLPLTSAVVMAAEKGNRIVFAIPRHEMVIVGTTDTDFTGDPASAHVTKEDVQYLLEISNRYFPGSALTEKDIVASYAGVRPLVHDGSASEGKTSREHTIISDPRGFTFVAGGKYTTYRKMSEEIVDRILGYLNFDTKARLKPCSTNSPLNPMVESETYRVAVQSAKSDLERQLAVRYGAEAKDILERFGVTENLWMIEAFQAIHKTMCLNLIDFYSRRVPLILAESDHGMRFLDDVAYVFQQELSLTDKEIAKQKSDLMAYIDSELAWKSKV